MGGDAGWRNLPWQSRPDQVLLKEYPEIIHNCQSHYLHTTLCRLNLSLSLKISQSQFHAKKKKMTSEQETEKKKGKETKESKREKSK